MLQGYVAAAIALLNVIGLSGCGEAPPPVDMERSYPLRAAYIATMQHASHQNLEISGICDGRAISTSSAPESTRYADFDSYVVTYNYRFLPDEDCPIEPFLGRSRTFYDHDFNPIASYFPDHLFTKFRARGEELKPMPEQARVGDQGELGYMVKYSDSDMKTYVGYTTAAYALQLNDDQQPQLELKVSDYNAFDQLLDISIDRYDLTAAGKLQYTSSIIHFNGDPMLELVLTLSDEQPHPAGE